MISIAIPCYRSSKTIRKVVEDVRACMQKHGLEYQFVLVNDGSVDDTFEEIKALCKEDSNIVGVNFSKNYGQHAARLAAIPYIRGDYVVYMDDDGQHPADGVIALYEKIKEGYDVVYANFPQKKHNGLKKIASKINTATLSMLADKPKNIRNSSFSIMRSYVLHEMRHYRSPYPSWTGFVVQITRNITDIELDHQDRIAGESGYSFKKMAKLYANSVTGFSIIPLRIASILGFVTAGAGFISGLVFIIRRLLNPHMPVGYASLMSALFLLTGVLMLILGLVGEYVGRIYMTISGMPQYTVKEVVNDKGNEQRE